MMMEEMIEIRLPVFVHTTKSKTTKGKAIFNLNNYRNWPYFKSNTAKAAMKAYISSLSMPMLGSGPFRLVYTYYHRNNAKVDVSNPCSVIDKFVCDAITELNVWPDDNVEYVKEVEYKWGGVDPDKEGYCTLQIFKL